VTGPVTPADVAAAREAVRDVARHTPVLPSETLGDRAGGTVLLKAETLQRTGSFKIRGALSKLAALGADAAAGVVAGSAGNHAQAVAFAARVRGVPCEVHMPREAPISKVEGAAALGARIVQEAASVEECVQDAARRAARDGMAFIHPYDDPDVIAGQGTLGLELLDDVPDLRRVIVPVGGGGLVSGVALAVRSARPDVEVIGVQAAAREGLTIADGIAVKRPGELTSALIRDWVDDVIEVGEDDVADAMVALLERAKLVVEGAGAAGAAALLSGRVRAAPHGSTVVVLSGGNVDAGLLATVARRHESEAGRRLVLFTRVPDRPGSLAALLALVGEQGANLVEVEHVREGVDLHVRESGVQLVLETRGREHAQRVLDALAAAGHDARVVR
jgi:threonine dehydratase